MMTFFARQSSFHLDFSFVVHSSTRHDVGFDYGNSPADIDIRF